MRIALIGAPGTDKVKIAQRCVLNLRFLQFKAFCVGDYAQEYLDKYVYPSPRTPNVLDQVNIVRKQCEWEKTAPQADFVFFDHPAICAYFTGMHRFMDVYDAAHRVAFSNMCQEILDSLVSFDQIFMVPGRFAEKETFGRERNSQMIEKNLYRFLLMFGVKHEVLQAKTLDLRVKEILQVLCETDVELKARLNGLAQGNQTERSKNA